MSTTNFPVDPIYGFPTDPRRRFICALVIEVILSNPNGDPDNNGAPRQSPDGHGWISRWSLNRMVRDYAKDVMGQTLYIDHGVDLATVQEEHEFSTEAVLDKNWDQRVFGGVLTQCKDAKGRPGRVRGPIQVRHAVSIGEIELEEVSMTRVCGSVEDNSDADDEASGTTDSRMRNNMGTVKLVTHALYKTLIHYNPVDGERTGLTSQDLEIFWAALLEAWDFRKSAVRSCVRIRRVYAINLPGLRSTVHEQHVEKRLTIEQGPEATTFEDYTITFDDSMEGLPSGTTIHKWEDGPCVETLTAEAAK